MLKYSVLS